MTYSFLVRRKPCKNVVPQRGCRAVRSRKTNLWKLEVPMHNPGVNTKKDRMDINNRKNVYWEPIIKLRTTGRSVYHKSSLLTPSPPPGPGRLPPNESWHGHLRPHNTRQNSNRSSGSVCHVSDDRRQPVWSEEGSCEGHPTGDESCVTLFQPNYPIKSK